MQRHVLFQIHAITIFALVFMFCCASFAAENKPVKINPYPDDLAKHRTKRLQKSFDKVRDDLPVEMNENDPNKVKTNIDSARKSVPVRRPFKAKEIVQQDEAVINAQTPKMPKSFQQKADDAVSDVQKILDRKGKPAAKRVSNDTVADELSLRKDMQRVTQDPKDEMSLEDRAERTAAAISRKAATGTSRKYVPNLKGGYTKKPAAKPAIKPATETIKKPEPEPVVEAAKVVQPVLDPVAAETKEIVAQEMPQESSIQPAQKEGIEQEFLVQHPDPALPGNARTWQALKKGALLDTLDGWSRIQGVTLVWNTEARYIIPETLQLDGDYGAAVFTLLDLYSDEPVRPVGQLFQDPEDGSQVLIIQSSGS